MSKQRTFRFKLDILPEEYVSYYKGAARWVVAKAYEGETVRFPASFLREFVSEDGVSGVFEMVIDDSDKLISLRRLKPSG